MNRNTTMEYRDSLKFADRMIGIVVSILLHVLVGVGFIFFSHSFSGSMIPMKSIDVDLASFPPAKGRPDAGVEKSPERMTEASSPVSERQETVHPEPVKPMPREKITEPEKPVVRDKAISLKKDRVNPVKKAVRPQEPSDDELIRKAISSVAKNVGKAPEKDVSPLADRLKSLAREAEKGPAGPRGNGGEKEGPPGGGTGNASLIEGYRKYVKEYVTGNWAFSQHLTGSARHLETWVTFEVLPDGEIINIEITKRSGNDYMDSAAVMAIKKSSPLRSLPPGINGTSMKTGLKFKPEELK